jgi:hypothetical protein
MKSATGFCVLALLTACSPKKSKTVEGKAPLPAPVALAPTQNGSLIGSWRSCVAYPQGQIIGVKSSSMIYTFEGESRVTLKAAFYTDEDCSSLFTRDKAEETFKHYESLGQVAAPDDVKAAVLELADGISEEMNYAASKVPAGDTGSLDFLSLQKPSYTSYRIWDDRIQIASVCHEAVEEDCDLAGETPLNRAMDMAEAEVLLRVE